MSTYSDYINVSREELIQLLASKMKKKRFQHVLRVEETGLALAEHYGISKTKTSIACLLHDLMKNNPDDSSRQSIISNNLPLDLLDYGNAIWHGPVAAVYAEKSLDVTDTDILNAIANHTVGSDHMSPLEQVVFVADYIEPQCDFPGVEKARELAKKDLALVVGFASRETIKHLLAQNQRIYPQTIHTYNMYSTLLGEELND